MRKLFRGRWKIVITFAAACVGLIGLNVMISRMTIDISPLPIDMAIGITATHTDADGSKQILADFDLPETLARPVFSPTRREFVVPPPPPPAAVEVVVIAAPPPTPSAPPTPPVIKLQGTRIVDGRTSALLVIDDKAPAWLGEGESISGWVIHSITTNGISLTMGSNSVAYSLYEPGKGRAVGLSN